ncbi:MAG: TlpA disulfide reductase family protein [Conexivisphaerales archaeon]
MKGFVNFKKITILLLLLLTVLTVKSYAYANINIALRSLNGQYLRTADFKNQLVFMTVFQSDCEYCQLEVADLNSLYNTPLIRRWFVFMGIDPYDSIDTIKRFQSRFGVEYPLYQANLNDIYSQLHVDFTPISFIVLNGRILGTFYGKHSYLSMKHALEQIIEEVKLYAN